MRFVVSLLAALFALAATPPASAGTAPAPTATPSAPAATLVPPPPSIAAKSYVLIDAFSHQVLAGQNETDQFDPASLTKLMTS